MYQIYLKWSDYHPEPWVELDKPYAKLKDAKLVARHYKSALKVPIKVMNTAKNTISEIY